MNRTNISDLRHIAQSIISLFTNDKTNELQKNLTFIDYHGFAKSRLPENVIAEVLKPFSYSSEQLQIEIVRVNNDLTDQVHYHQFSHAFICVLSKENNFHAPINALAYKNDKWVEIDKNYQDFIYPNTPHGFTVSKNGLLYFLSVQTPPIVHNGFDDYHQY